MAIWIESPASIGTLVAVGIYNPIYKLSLRNNCIIFLYAEQSGIPDIGFHLILLLFCHLCPVGTIRG